MHGRASNGGALARVGAYAFALLTIAIAAGGRSLLNQITDPHIPLVAFHVAILVTALLGGFGPALLGLASGYLVAGFGFAAPRGPLGVFGMPDLSATAAYLIGGVAVAGTAAAVRSLRTQVRLNAPREEQGRLDVHQQIAANAPVRSPTSPPSPVRETHARADDRIAVTPTAVAGRRIHVVDDARDSADSLALLLRMHGHIVEVSYDGLSALAADAPDVMIVDVGLPDMSGFDVARRLRIDPRFARTFLIGLSGFSLDEDRERATSAGFDRYLTKPVDLEMLREIIDGL